MEDGCIKRVCVECGEAFEITRDQVTWLEDRRLELFRRCSNCRAKRRLEREGARENAYKRN